NVFFSFVEAKTCTAQQSAVPALDGRTKGAKREASPDVNSPGKRIRVAIKHIPKDKVSRTEDYKGQTLAAEVAVMLKLANGQEGSVGTPAPVSLLDWYSVDEELILVLERPVPSEDLCDYLNNKVDYPDEKEAKIIIQQLVEAAKHLEDNLIFHRDIKPENILIETGSDVPRVRLIDFGLSCSFEKESSFSAFCGTAEHTPPEWHRTSVYKPGPTTVWQMGVVLYEILHDSFDTVKFLKDELDINNKLSVGK
ncbi:Serine/threonine-protein kinase pim-3, partial [Nibea albiflora]